MLDLQRNQKIVVYISIDPEVFSFTLAGTSLIET